MDERAAGKASSHHVQPLQWKTEREETVGCCPLQLSPAMGGLKPQQLAGRAHHWPRTLGFFSQSMETRGPYQSQLYLLDSCCQDPVTVSEEEYPTEMIVTGGSEWF